MKERLRGTDYRFIAICLALLGATVWFSAGNFYKAFPEASIDFKVSRASGRDAAATFLAGQGYSLSDYRDAAEFDYDDDAKTFLERTLGLEQGNALMGRRVRLWRWKYRWFRPLQKEEFRVDITPRGELSGFQHELPEDAARPDATNDQARALAENFLRTKMARDPAALDFVEEADVTRPHRTDRTFTWKERGFEVHDATYRLSLTVLGNEVGAYREYLKVPEQWKRDYQRLRAKNEMAQNVDSVAMAALMIALVVVIVLRVTRQDVRWRWAAKIGLAGIVLAFLAQMNEFPLHEFSYSTTDSYSSFVFRLFLNAALASLGTGGFLFVLAAGAEPVYREYLADKISLGGLMSVRGLRTKRFFLGTILGLTLTGIFIAYQTAFYIVAYRYGAWSPADVPYTDLLNTRFPWAFVLFGGFFPAVFEEFAFRMFAIPFLRKVTRSIAVAVVVAGFVWGFGHSSYPQQPFYIRGMEVGIGGVALGIIMLRFGILPTLVWHYSVDAMYSAMLLMRSQSLYYKMSGVVAAGIMVLPVLVALVAYLRKGGFETEEGLRNADEGTSAAQEQAAVETAAAEEAQPTVPYAPLTTGVRCAAAALLVAGLATLALPVKEFGERPKYQIPAEKARGAASAYLLVQGVDAGAYQHVTYPAAHWDGRDELAAKYFLEHVPLERASALFEQNRPAHHWVTRYFRPLDEEEFSVSVHPETARAMGFQHKVPEDRPGANLPVEQARDIAARFAASRGWDVAAMDLKESSLEKKKARTDATFEWEARPGDPRNVDETKFRVGVEMAGDKVSGAGVFWKTPEAFDRSRESSNAVSIAVTVAHIAVGAGLLVFALWTLVQGSRQGVVRWRRALMVALPGVVLYPVGPLLLLDQRLRNYNTSKPIETFHVEGFLQILTGLMGTALLLALAAALIVTFYPRAVEELRRGNRRMMGMDAAFAVMAAAGIALIFRHLGAALTSMFHAQALLDVGAPAIIVSTAPAVAAVTDAVSEVITRGAALGLVAMMVYQTKRLWLLLLGVLIGLGALVSTDARTLSEFSLEYGMAVSVAAAVVVFCWFFGRRNYLAYALILWLAALQGPLSDLMGTGNPSLQAQAWAIVVVMVLSVLWAVGPAVWKADARPSGSAALS